MKSMVAGQGWSCERTNGGNEKEEEVGLGTATRKDVESTDRKHDACSHLMFTCGNEKRAT